MRGSWLFDVGEVLLSRSSGVGKSSIALTLEADDEDELVEILKSEGIFEPLNSIS